jgi:hypothetical protein
LTASFPQNVILLRAKKITNKEKSMASKEKNMTRKTKIQRGLSKTKRAKERTPYGKTMNSLVRDNPPNPLRTPRRRANLARKTKIKYTRKARQDRSHTRRVKGMKLEVKKNNSRLRDSLRSSLRTPHRRRMVGTPALL